jgi:hypothetical protein
MKGWNYTVRLYRPRIEILNGTWKFPEAGRSEEICPIRVVHLPLRARRDLTKVQFKIDILHGMM